jgi:hypothetical protein
MLAYVTKNIHTLVTRAGELAPVQSALLGVKFGVGNPTQCRRPVACFVQTEAVTDTLLFAANLSFSL